MVYPRGCGGTTIAAFPKLSIQGLSPRVRGNLLLADRLRAGKGSIPAGAGEPELVQVSQILSRVYPRGCGGTESASPEVSA